MSERELELQRLIDEKKIQEILAIYCYAMDEYDQDLLSKVFWPDARLDYGMFKGTGQEFTDSIFKWRQGRGMGLTLHYISNSLIQVSKDNAWGVTYFRAYHRMPEDGESGAHDIFIGGRYHDKFQKRGGEWRISARSLLFDWFRREEGTGDWANGPHNINHASAAISDPGKTIWPEMKAEILRIGN